MKLRTQGRRRRPPVVDSVKKSRSSFAVVALGAFAALGCHHTWQGVKEDTRDAVHETGRELEKAGKKMQGTGENKGASRGDAGAPSSPR